ncbi:hypothetical protein FHT21_001171 [Pedobacter sp. SG908]|nr:hypothetical protein [Pedobacter sp. SG908]
MPDVGEAIKVSDIILLNASNKKKQRAIPEYPHYLLIYLRTTQTIRKRMAQTSIWAKL